MDRIYHRFEHWECYKAGFFKNSSPEEKENQAKKVIELFSNPKQTEIFMKKVLVLWPNSCEHNLTNMSMNRVAWIGQSACCLYAQIPYRITMENWRFVPKEFQEIACDIAEKVIKEFEVNYKTRQLCLNFI